MAQIAFRQDLTHSKHLFAYRCDPFDDNLPEPDDFLLKTKFFSRIGIGLKTMLSIPIQRRQSITTSLNQSDSREEPQSCEQSPKPGCAQLKCDESFDEKSTENIQRARKNTSSKLSAILSIKRKSYSEDFIALQRQERCIENYEESMKKFESGKGSGPANTIKRALTETVEDTSHDFFAKTDHQMRTCYYNRLIQMRILKPTPSKKNQNIIIFDWDDTLLCTSYLLALGIKSAAPTILSVLKPVDDIASKLLNKSTDLGQVFIITNAELGWVQSSARNFLPKTYAVIEKASITVISARACYEDEFPGDNERWKKEAFLSLSRMFEKEIITNLICIGDSDAEINAARFLAKEFNTAIIKTIKFKEKPKPEELTKQHSLVLDKFDKLFVSLRNSEIRLERKHK